MICWFIHYLIKSKLFSNFLDYKIIFPVIFKSKSVDSTLNILVFLDKFGFGKSLWVFCFFKHLSTFYRQNKKINTLRWSHVTNQQWYTLYNYRLGCETGSSFMNAKISDICTPVLCFGPALCGSSCRFAFISDARWNASDSPLWDSSVSPTHMLCWCITNKTPSCGSMKEMSSHQNIRLTHWCQSAKQVVRCTFWNVKQERCLQDHFPFGKCRKSFSINQHVGTDAAFFRVVYILVKPI